MTGNRRLSVIFIILKKIKKILNFLCLIIKDVGGKKSESHQN